ncbi:MAG: serine--tRNA ligase [Christensenellales bacterium]|jgi:seryl-tRNA synthetase
MLDLKKINGDREAFQEAMEKRNFKADTGQLFSLDTKRKQLLIQTEQLKARRNLVSGQIPKLAKEGKDITSLKDEMRAVGDEVQKLDGSLRSVEEELRDVLLRIPNMPSKATPYGKDSDSNVEVRLVGGPRCFDFEPLPHWDIGENRGILDFATAAKVTGARFTFYRGLGARLERALINYMLDLHTKNGYEEVLPPYIVNRDSMTGTGQLPKFEEDAFKLANNPDYFLIPTAEVPVTNMYRDSIIDGPMPKKHTAYSACFRAEAGSAGRDTRGLIRQHQFNKVELIKFCTPETSYHELEMLTLDAEKVLQGLGLPYRVMLLCGGDLGFSAAQTYDIEVWMPSYERYVEISSCSNFEDYQARRANIRFRPEKKSKPQYVHTLNGSGVAVGRALAAVLENYQQSDGSVRVPEVLRPYMGVDVI